MVDFKSDCQQLNTTVATFVDDNFHGLNFSLNRSNKDALLQISTDDSDKTGCDTSFFVFLLIALAVGIIGNALSVAIFGFTKLKLANKFKKIFNYINKLSIYSVLLMIFYLFFIKEKRVKPNPLHVSVS
jgi:uncharacterized protein YqhQ